MNYFVFHYVYTWGGAVYASIHGIQKRPSDLLELQGGMKYPV